MDIVDTYSIMTPEGNVDIPRCKSVVEMLNEAAALREKNGRWIPACGGTEIPMTIRGVRVLYCWNTGTKQHAYLNLDTDIIMTDAEYNALCGRH